MSDEIDATLVGAAGGAGAAVGAALGVLIRGDLKTGALLAVALGAILSGTLLLFISHREKLKR